MARTRKIPAPRVSKNTRARNDGWSNAFSGFGVEGKDKRLGSTFSTDWVDQDAADAVWQGDSLMGRIVETIPAEMTREGGCVKIQDQKDQAEAADTKLRDLGAIPKFRKAMEYARAFGGGGILMGADDGARGPDGLAQPLDLKRVKTIKWLTTYTPKELRADRYYADPTQEKFGEISHYRLVPIQTPEGVNAANYPLVHESRILRFDGVVTTRQQLYRGLYPGWGASVLARCLQAVNDATHSHQGASILAQDFAPRVLQMPGLQNILRNAKPGDTTLAVRAAALERSVSLARIAIIDKDETLERKTTNLSGLPDLLDRIMKWVAMEAKMPVTLLMGESPAGLNATGDSDIRWFYDQVSAEQENVLLPQLKRLLEVIFSSKDGPTSGQIPKNWNYEFNPLWALTEKEQAEIEKLVADKDCAYIDRGVLLPLDVTKSRYGGEVYSTTTTIEDIGEYEKLKEEIDAAKLEAEAALEEEGEEGEGKPADKDADLSKGEKAEK